MSGTHTNIYEYKSTEYFCIDIGKKSTLPWFRFALMEHCLGKFMNGSLHLAPVFLDSLVAMPTSQEYCFYSSLQSWSSSPCQLSETEGSFRYLMWRWWSVGNCANHLFSHSIGLLLHSPIFLDVYRSPHHPCPSILQMDYASPADILPWENCPEINPQSWQWAQHHRQSHPIAIKSHQIGDSTPFPVQIQPWRLDVCVHTWHCSLWMASIHH